MISRILVLLAMLTLFPHLAFAQQQGQVKCVRDNAGNIYCPKRQPVDLSRIGLEGIETDNRTRESQARIEALEAQTRAYEAQQRRDNAAPPKQAIAASPAIRKQAAYAYEPYIFCVIDNARSFSAGPDTATDIATAAVTACSAKKWESYVSFPVKQTLQK